MTRATTLTLALLLAATGLIAQTGNYTEFTQGGQDNVAELNQSFSPGSLVGVQDGSMNSLRAFQRGSGVDVFVEQIGVVGTININQNGVAQLMTIEQLGEMNTLTATQRDEATELKVAQDGFDNSTTTFQDGLNGLMQIEQLGQGNTLSASQKLDDHTMVLSQNGANNTLRVTVF